MQVVTKKSVIIVLIIVLMTGGIIICISEKVVALVVPTYQSKEIMLVPGFLTTYRGFLLLDFPRRDGFTVGAHLLCLGRVGLKVGLPSRRTGVGQEVGDNIGHI